MNHERIGCSENTYGIHLRIAERGPSMGLALDRSAVGAAGS